MRLTPQQKSSLTPLARWLLDYVREREITLTELSRDAGLSLGALRSLVIYPQRVPKLETCLQLAKVTGEPPDKVIGLAGLHAPTDLSNLDPDRIKLLRTYDGLHNPQLQRTLLAIGQLLLHGEQV